MEKKAEKNYKLFKENLYRLEQYKKASSNLQKVKNELKSAQVNYDRAVERLFFWEQEQIKAQNAYDKIKASLIKDKLI